MCGHRGPASARNRAAATQTANRECRPTLLTVVTSCPCEKDAQRAQGLDSRSESMSTERTDFLRLLAFTLGAGAIGILAILSLIR
jgi:hypothetical protein